MLSFVAFLVFLVLVLAALAGFIYAMKPVAADASEPVAPMGPAWVGRLLPEHPTRAFVASVVAAALLGLGLVLLGTLQPARARYGWTLFLLAPFTMGFVAACLTTYRQRPTAGRFAAAGTCAALIAGLGFLAFGSEGLVCLLMAAPVTVPCSVAGSLIAYLLYSQGRSRRAAMGMMICVVPLGLVAEPALVGAPPATTVRSTIEIHAPPSVVWAHLVEFDPITAPVDSWFFRAGVAYPISATLMDAPGVGAMRVCDFSTGRFVETVRVWEEHHRLMFTIESGPPVLREWSPYGDIHPPHVQGYFLPESGDFTLVPLASGGTRLEGTSVYRHRMWPATGVCGLMRS